MDDDLARGREAFSQRAEEVTLADLGFVPRASSRYSYLKLRREGKEKDSIGDDADHALPRSPESAAPTRRAREASAPRATTARKSCRLRHSANLAAAEGPQEAHRRACGAGSAPPSSFAPTAATQPPCEAFCRVSSATQGASETRGSTCPPPTATTRELSRCRHGATPPPFEEPHAACEHGDAASWRPMELQQPCAPRPPSLFDRKMHVVRNADGRVRVLVPTVR